MTGVPRRRLVARLRRGIKRLLRFLPRTQGFDKLFFLIFFFERHRRLPRRDSGLMNDYLFYLKADRVLADPLYQYTTDKVYAKHFIDHIVGCRVTPETYAVFDSVDAIRRHDLPDRCVLKPTHGTGGAVVFLKGPEALLTEPDYATLRWGFGMDVYSDSREINYKHLRKRIICEELVNGREQIKDYKLFCFGGSVKLVSVSHQWHSRENMMLMIEPQNFYDRA